MVSEMQNIASMSWTEYKEKKGSIVILPVGSTEQHGPHLPLGVDSILAERFSTLLATEIDGIVAPTISYGYKSKPMSGGGPLFPGTIDLNGVTLQQLTYDVLKELALDGFTRILIMNAHFENDPFLIEAMDAANSYFQGSVNMVLTNWWDPLPQTLIERIFDEVPFPGWASEHAAITETSLMLHFAPDLVKTNAFVNCETVQPLSYYQYPIPRDAIPSSGVLSSAFSSSAKKGQLIADTAIEALKLIVQKTLTPQNG